MDKSQFHVGRPLIGGLVCALLHYSGIFLLVRKASQLKHEPLVVLMIGQLLAVCTMPLLMHSFQYIAYALIGSVIVSSEMAMAPRPDGQPLHATTPVADGAVPA